MRARVELVVAGVLTLLAVLLHLVFLLHAGALWRDEVNSLEFARMPLPVAWHNLQYDSFPILSTFVLHGFSSATGAGVSPTPAADRLLRIYGFVIGLSFLAALWITCRTLGGRASAPLLSLALVGMAPWAVQAIDSIRPYGLGIVLIVLTAGFVWRVVSAPFSPARVAIAAILAILSVQTMYQDAFLLLAICVAGVVVAWRRTETRTALSVLGIGAAAALSLLMYMPALAGARGWNVLVQRPTPVSWLFNVFAEAATPEHALLDAKIFLVIWVALAVVCVVVASRVLRARGRQAASAGATADPALFCGVLVFSAIVFYFAGLLAARVRTEPWYYVPLMALLAPAIDVVIAGTMIRAAARATPRMAARLVLVIGLAGVTVAPAWVQLSKSRTSMDKAAALVSREAAPTDLVVVFPFFYGVSFQRYYHGAAPWVSVPPLADLRIHRYDLVKQRMMEPTETMASVFAQMSEAMKSGHRVWIVGSLPPPDPGVIPTGPSPAPDPVTQWNCAPYLHVWGQEVAQFLEDHATEGRIAQGLSGGKVNPFEDVPVTVPSGWKDAPAQAGGSAGTSAAGTSAARP